MTNYVTGSTIKFLREKKGYTQRELAENLHVSPKTVSKWETQKGFPDICIIEALAENLGVSLAELLSGKCLVNNNKSSNLLRGGFYVCPVCGNVIYSTGQGAFCCCGITLPVLEGEEAAEGEHFISIERMGNEYYIVLEHSMDKEHYISFLAYITADRVQMVKLYPEQNPETCFPITGKGIIYAYCNRDGLFQKVVGKLN